MKFVPILVVIAALTACSKAPNELAAKPRALSSGVELSGMDKTIRPQDDFYAYANGVWLRETEIPADQFGWGSYMTLRDDSLTKLRSIVEEVAADTNDNKTIAKIGGYYTAWLDEARIEKLGMQPLAKSLAEIDALKDHADVARWLGETNEVGIDGPFNLYVNQDDKDSTKYVLFIVQSGLGLPDRDYYFDQSERGLELRDGYVAVVEKLLSMSGYADATAAAGRIMALETALAEHQWDKVKSRDADAVYNKTSDADLGKLISNFNPDAYFAGIGTGRPEYVIVSQPSYLEAANRIFLATDLNTWKEYLRLNTLFAFASFLPKDFVDAQFEFFSKALYGREEQPPRWQRAILSMNGNIGELLGQLYVQEYFPPEAKERMVGMVDNLMKAYADSIRNLEWMSEDTKEKALQKLAKFTPKIGYPDEWKDYSALEISDKDLIGNIRNARRFNHYLQVDKLGKPINRNEWFLPPQTVNAYYNPGLNEIVFPAAYLQAPNFQLDAEDAYNYGAIGTTIGHEIGHGFDDQGSKYDGDGNLKSWWTDDDRARFEERTRGLVEQFNGFEAAPGLFVNGEFTLGENIGDLGGTAIALKAYRMSLNGEESPVINGFTGEERFFLGFAQSSRIKWRQQMIELLVKTDPHSPDEFRINGVVPNVEDFYITYRVKEGDAHFLAPEQRVRIWQ
ncbi:MAG: peptidase M13 [Gammaproteobacteria bacterium]|nr:peptidase M13 [Gammaproteobacteria bacterium]MDH4315774.1 peptidase M13 [Gammaproteobacteria bacterium]MDH5215082.1 peptidase M13 [Gammaproteobacteria bacterium]MDH5500256.1 peptidase M13 [Gammaproteobacteria bacterium]